jgi:hypothetical protein
MDIPPSVTGNAVGIAPGFISRAKRVTLSLSLGPDDFIRRSEFAHAILMSAAG